MTLWPLKLREIAPSHPDAHPDLPWWRRNADGWWTRVDGRHAMMWAPHYLDDVNPEDGVLLKRMLSMSIEEREVDAFNQLRAFDAGEPRPFPGLRPGQVWVETHAADEFEPRVGIDGGEWFRIVTITSMEPLRDDDEPEPGRWHFGFACSRNAEAPYYLDDVNPTKQPANRCFRYLLADPVCPWLAPWAAPTARS